MIIPKVDYVFYTALIVSLYSIFSVCLFPVVIVWFIKDYYCNITCRIDTYNLGLATLALVVTAFFYWYNTRHIRSTAHKWGGTVTLFLLSTLLLFTQLSFVIDVFDDEEMPETYIKIGSGGVSLLTLLVVILGFVVNGGGNK